MSTVPQATADPEGIFSLTDFDGIFGLGYSGISVQEVVAQEAH